MEYKIRKSLLLTTTNLYLSEYCDRAFWYQRLFIRRPIAKSLSAPAVIGAERRSATKVADGMKTSGPSGRTAPIEIIGGKNITIEASQTGWDTLVKVEGDVENLIVRDGSPRRRKT